MGFALLALRGGDGPAALEAVSSAVLLTPRRALYRSYWAKFLYDLRRNEAALAVLEVARNLDPRDPTPALYRSMILRDLNRPGEAIRALRHAVALNDNRAVYRSRFLLDRDLASKNIDLSNVYRELSLDDWGIQKATEAVREDYANASGHLYYAGALTDADDRSYARNTENLLARLLIPATANAFNTFEDYTTFLERPNFETQVTAAFGNLDHRGIEALHYGASPRHDIAYQVGVLAETTRGLRTTNGEASENLVGFLKWNPSENQGVMLAASLANFRQNDIAAPRFEHDDPGQPNDELDSKLTRVEAGYHHRFRPGADLLLHVQRIEPRTEEDICSLSLGPNTICTDGLAQIRFRDTSEQPFTLAQGELIFDWGAHQTIIGTAHHLGDDRFTRRASLGPPPVPVPFLAVNSNQARNLHTVFLHDLWRILPNLGLEAAAYLDWYDVPNGAQGTDNRFFRPNPRIGLFWNATPETTVRLAAFRYVLPFLSDRIEPADVAGLPVYRNGLPGSLTREIAGQVSHEWERGAFRLGGAFFKREFDLELAAGGRRQFDDSQWNLGGSVNLLVGDQAGLSLEYDHRRRRGDFSASDDRNEHFLKGRFKWVDPSGAFLSFDQTWRHIDFQNGGRGNESIFISDFLAGVEFADKNGEIRFEVRNIFDSEFDWVTDSFDITGRVPGREVVVTLTLHF